MYTGEEKRKEKEVKEGWEEKRTKAWAKIEATREEMQRWKEEEGGAVEKIVGRIRERLKEKRKKERKEK